MDLENYDLIEKPIGFGSYGKVFRGKIKETGQDIAVKFIDKVGFGVFNLCGLMSPSPLN